MFYPTKDCFRHQRRLIPVVTGIILLFWLMCGFLRKSDVHSYTGMHENALVADVFKSREIRVNPYYMFNCSNVHLIRLERALGHGWRKEGFLGDFNGTKVVVKLGTKNTQKAAECIKPMNNIKPRKDVKKTTSQCVATQTMQYLMREILLSEQLNHPGLARLLGYCVRHPVVADTLNISDHGIVSVFEFGNGTVDNHAVLMSWKEKIERAAEIAGFLDYLEHSPMGSLVVSDFRTDHFLLVNNRFKLIDIDDVSSIDRDCSYVCPSGVVCQNINCKGFNAKGFNAKRNVYSMYKQLFIPLFNLKKTKYQPPIDDELSELFSKMRTKTITAANVQIRLQNMLKIAEK